jgi:hypothetical protein
MFSLIFCCSEESEMGAHAFAYPTLSQSLKLMSRYFLLVPVCSGVRGSVVGVATHYGLDGPVFELLWGRHFLHPSTPAPRTTKPSVQWVWRLFTGSKVAGTWRWWPVFVADDKEGWSYTSTSAQTFVACYRVNFTLTLHMGSEIFSLLCQEWNELWSITDLRCVRVCACVSACACMHFFKTVVIEWKNSMWNSNHLKLFQWNNSV